MNNAETVVAMTVAGSDSGGGAGIQADLAAFSYFGCFGTTVVTAVTAQNPKTVTAVQGIAPDLVRQQLQAVRDIIAVRACKTGMLFNADIISVAAAAFREWKIPLVVDPVMVATSGAQLLQASAVDALCNCLLPLATVITPNLPEAEILVQRKLTDIADMEQAAMQLALAYDATVMLKGGHCIDATAVDVISDGRSLWRLSAPRCEAHSTHGSGCALSAAITACLAQGDDILTALKHAKAYVYGCICSTVEIGSGVYALHAPDRLMLEAVNCTELRLNLNS